METKKIEEFKKGDVIRLQLEDGFIDDYPFVYLGYSRTLKGYRLDSYDGEGVIVVVKKGRLATYNL